MKRALTKRLWLFAVTCLTVQALAQSTTQSLISPGPSKRAASRIMQHRSWVPLQGRYHAKAA